MNPISEELLAGEVITPTDAFKRLGCTNLDKQIKQLRAAGWKIKRRRIGGAAAPTVEFWMEDAARQEQVEKNRIAAGEKHWGGDLKRLFNGSTAGNGTKGNPGISGSGYLLRSRSTDKYFFNISQNRAGKMAARWSDNPKGCQVFETAAAATRFRHRHNLVSTQPVLR